MSNPTTTNYIIIEGVFADGKHLISAELTEATPSPGKTREIPREVFSTIRQVFKGTWTVGSDDYPRPARIKLPRSGERSPRYPRRRVHAPV